jgi:hypothetical protein
MKARGQRFKKSGLKFLLSIAAILIISSTLPTVAQAQVKGGADLSVFPYVVTSSGYKSTRLRAGSTCQRYRAWRDRYECEDWQRSFSPFWAQDVTGDLLASAPTYYNWIPFTLEFGHWP